MADRIPHQFESLFKVHFKPLCLFSYKFTRDFEESKNLVHEVFLTMWEKFEQFPADTNYKSYLFTAVRNRSLNFLRDRKSQVDLELISETIAAEESDTISGKEIESKVKDALEAMPERCREIFQLNRDEGLRYAQIAEQLGISVKTVETQMSKALAILREHLAEFLTILIFLLLTSG